MSRKSKRPTDIEEIPAYILRTYGFDILGDMTSQKIYQVEQGKKIEIFYKNQWRKKLDRKKVLSHLRNKSSELKWELLEEKLSPGHYESELYGAENYDEYSVPSALERYQEVAKEELETEAEELDKRWQEAREALQEYKPLRAKYYRSMEKYYKTLALLDEGEEDPFPRKVGREENTQINYYITDLKDIICNPNKKNKSGNSQDEPEYNPNYLDIGLVLIYFKLIKKGFPTDLKMKKNLDQYVRRVDGRIQERHSSN